MVVRYLTKAEIRRVFDHATTNRNRAILNVLIRTGMRIGECAGLQVRDLDVEGGTVRIERIVVPINVRLLDIKYGENGGQPPLYKRDRKIGLYLPPDGKVKQVLPEDLRDFLREHMPDAHEFVKIGTKARKDQTGRVVPLRDEGTWKALEAEIFEREPMEWLWTTPYSMAKNRGSRQGESNAPWNGRLTYQGIRTMVIRTMKAAQIPPEKCHPHTTRHTFAVQNLNEGMDLITLQHIGGWANITMLARYAQLAVKHLVRKTDAVDLGY